LEVVKLPEAEGGFVLLPPRWVVERAIAGHNRNRRLSKDYERTEPAMKPWRYLASMTLLLRPVRPNSHREIPYAPKAA
jgi:putative transposase